MSTPPLDSTLAAQHFFAGAAAAGMTRVIVAPGSRSTALALAANRRSDIEIAIHLDERTAAFAALGEAKLSGLPVGVVCTSGTAAANLLPAVAEASLSHIPLVVITADRPPEHQHWGVGQSFDQRGLFHRQVRDEITMPVGGAGGAAFTERAGWRAAITAREQHGPVHVNWAFRLPLEPAGDQTVPPSPLRAHPTDPAQRGADPRDVETLTEAINASERPVAIAGPDTLGPGAHGASEALVHRLAAIGIPVLADALSGLWGDEALVEAPAHVVHHAPSVAPDLVIRFGQTPTNKATRLWWETLTDAHHLLVDPLSQWHDPSHLTRTVLRSAPAALIGALSPDCGAHIADSHLAAWTGAGRATQVIVDQVLADTAAVTEAHVAQALMTSRLRTVVASSSMPVRDIDLFGRTDSPIRVVSNRGINGIDGVVATATGVSRAVGGRVGVLIGDVALLHDIGSVLDAARHEVALTIVVPNNDGGGIFSNLPIRQSIPETEFQTLFHTPHGSDFAFLAGHDGIEYRHVDTNDALRDALTDSAQVGGVRIVEVPVTTPERLELSDRLRHALSS